MLLSKNSKANMLKVQEWVGRDKERIRVLFSLLKENDYRKNQRAAWVIGNMPGELIREHWKELLEAAENPSASDSVKRNTLRLLQSFLPEEELLGKVWEFAFHMAAKRDEPIAVRAFAFGTMENICRVFPELKTEMKELALQERPYTQKGLLNRIERVLKRN